MYLSHYGLPEKPFQINTDPRFLWLGEKHLEALAVLKYGVIDRNGFVVLTGDAGTGKTTLVNALIESLDDSFLVANINNPKLDAAEFLTLVARSFDPRATVERKVDFIIFFTDFLQKTHRVGKTALLVVDEAHRLSVDLLEEIRLLSNIEHQDRKLINIFFVGQNELKQTLMMPECRALRQRITLFYDIQPLSADETLPYIEHRLKVAGTETQPFTQLAVREIHRLSQGFPRSINVICDRALLTGYIRDTLNITLEIVSECGREIPIADEAVSTATVAPTAKIPAAQPKTASNAADMRSAARKGLKQLIEDGHRAAKNAGQMCRRTAEAGKNQAAASLRTIKGALARPGAHGAKTASNSASIADTPEYASRQRRKVTTYGSLVVGVAVVAAMLILIVQARTERPLPPRSGKAAAETRAQSAAIQSPLPFAAPTGTHEKITPAQTAAAGGAPAPNTSLSAKAVEQTQSANTTELTTAKTFSANRPVETSRLPEASIDTRLKATDSPPSQPQTPKTDLLPDPLDAARKALAQADFDKAITLLEPITAVSPDAPPEAKELYALALIGQSERLAETKREEADILLSKAAAAAPQSTAANFEIGKIRTRWQDYAGAATAYRQVLDLAPDFAEAVYNLGYVYAKTEKYADAELMFSRTVTLQPAFIDKALFNLSMVQQALGKEQESLANLRAAVAANPDNRRAMAYLQKFGKTSGSAP